MKIIRFKTPEQAFIWLSSHAEEITDLVCEKYDKYDYVLVVKVKQ